MAAVTTLTKAFMSKQPRESDPPGKTGRVAPHTSIIYFHGMGTPKRYEELSRVLDTLDRYAEAQNDQKTGMLRGQTVGFEKCRVGGDDPIAFLQFTRFLPKQAGNRHFGAGRFRLYESFWSPAAAGGVWWGAVLVWVLQRISNPITVLCRPWRAHQRLKTTFLNRMFFDRDKVPVLHFQRLAAAYHAFEGMGARRRHPRGTFAQFRQSISAEYASKPEERDEILTLAFRWRKSLRRSQYEVLVVAAGVASIAVGVITMAVFLLAYWSQMLGFAPPLIAHLVGGGGAVAPWFATMWTLMLCAFGIGVGRFLNLFLSDVVFWTTTLEKDVRYRRRKEILSAAESTLRHVLSDPECERVVILAHSLGTAIAYETLLSLGRKLATERRSGEPADGNSLEGLSKISHYISLGSPIDRISYFFQLTFSRFHRFNRVADTLLGRTSDLPFKQDRQSRIQWINVRDPADPVASRLFSPRGAVPNRDEIQEVEVSSSHFPEPAGAHTGYFNSTLAAKVLFDACVLGRNSLQLQQVRPEWSKRSARALRMIASWLLPVFTTALGLGAAAYWTANRTLLLVALTAGLASFNGLVAMALLGWLLDRKHSLQLPP